MKELLRALTPGERDWRIATQLDPKRLPAHIAIIMDGNGRWAKQRNFPRIMGHKAGVSSVRSIVETCADAAINRLPDTAHAIWKASRAPVRTLGGASDSAMLVTSPPPLASGSAARRAYRTGRLEAPCGSSPSP